MGCSLSRKMGGGLPNCSTILFHWSISDGVFTVKDNNIPSQILKETAAVTLDLNALITFLKHKWSEQGLVLPSDDPGSFHVGIRGGGAGEGGGSKLNERALGKHKGVTMIVSTN